MQVIILSLFLIGISWAQPADPTLYTFPYPRIPIPITTTPGPSDDGTTPSTTPSPWSFGIPLSTVFNQRPRVLSNFPHSAIPFSHSPHVREWNHTLPTHNLQHLPNWIINRNRTEDTPTTSRPWRWEYTGGRWRRVWNSDGSWNISAVGESSTQRVRPQGNWGYHPASGLQNHHVQVQSSHSSNYNQGVHDENTSRQVDHKYSLTSDSGPSSPEDGEGSDDNVSTSGSSGGSVSSEGSDSGQGSGSE